jgi:hypothetical protein
MNLPSLAMMVIVVIGNVALGIVLIRIVVAAIVVKSLLGERQTRLVVYIMEIKNKYNKNVD